MDNPNRRFEFLLENFRAANKRLIFRIKQRDLWLRYQLLSQLLLFAVVVVGKSAFPGQAGYLHALLTLAFPVAVLCCTLYTAQDRLVAHIIAYVNALSGQAAKYGSQVDVVHNLESSPEGRNYTRTALPIRLVGQLFTFLLLPTWLSCYRVFSKDGGETIHMMMGGLDILLAAIVIWLLSSSFGHRRK